MNQSVLVTTQYCGQYLENTRELWFVQRKTEKVHHHTFFVSSFYVDFKGMILHERKEISLSRIIPDIIPSVSYLPCY